jgi:class 3 adenylate cyclase
MWGTEDFVTTVLPSKANDQSYKTWMAMVMRISASPRMAAAQYGYLYKFDARELLHLVQAPTLVLHRKDSQFFPPAHGRFLAEQIAGSRFIEVPGTDEVPATDHGDEILSHIEEFVTGVRPSPAPDRVLAAVLFTDIVRSTERAAALGDRAWKELLQSHDMLAETIIGQHQGRFVKSTGDGILATFDGPGRAIRCARAFQEALRPLSVEIRMGLHTGEVELRGEDIGGIGVHVAARVLEHARPGELLASAAVPMLVAGSGIEFDDRGEHELKGVPGSWRLLAVQV